MLISLKRQNSCEAARPYVDLHALGLVLSEITGLLTLLFILGGPFATQREQHHPLHGHEMSEAEELEYKRAALQILSSILGDLVPDFWKTLIDQWEQEGRPGISPVDRRYPLDELSKMATEWLQARKTLH
jgi:hypothetical protein